MHLSRGAFKKAVTQGRWRLVAIDWPFATFCVGAKDGREFGFRFECRDYPSTPVTARPWDLEAQAPLDGAKWPFGPNRVSLAFNPGWKNGQCLYLPCDRLSIDGHENWRFQHPHLAWNPSLGIAHYLRIIFDLLNSGDYRGVRGA